MYICPAEREKEVDLEVSSPTKWQSGRIKADQDFLSYTVKERPQLLYMRKMPFIHFGTKTCSPKEK
jgi:hypothetical protein